MTRDKYLDEITLKLSTEDLEKVVAHELAMFDERIHFDAEKARCLPEPLQNTVYKLGKELDEGEKRRAYCRLYRK